jgi:hypothetical protein
LNQNFIFKDGTEIVIIKNEVSSIVNATEYFIKQPQALELIGQNVRKKFAAVYSNEYQMNKRLAVLSEYL